MGFHYSTTNKTFECGWEEFVHGWLDGNVVNGGWFDHMAGWYQISQENPESVLLVWYEDLKIETKNTIQSIAEFVVMATILKG